MSQTKTLRELVGSRLVLSKRASMLRQLGSLLGQAFLLFITSVSAFAVLLIFIFVIKDAVPFFQLKGFREFLFSTKWYPSGNPAEFGAASIIFGSALVTAGAVLFAVPLGLTAAVCLSDVLPFSARQLVKPVIEMLATVPSVAYGFFALVVLAPLLQNKGGPILAGLVWIVGIPVLALASIIFSETFLLIVPKENKKFFRAPVIITLLAVSFLALYWVSGKALAVQISSGANALNVSIILGIMVLPTIVSVSEDALQAVGRELREASYACGATRAETLLQVVIPAAGSGICAAVILGIMRAVGETMVVWMASGNAAQIPKPWFNFFEPIRTLTATIAGDMGEADQVTGSARYHVLFALAAVLLLISFLCNLGSEWAVRRERRKLQGL